MRILKGNARRELITYLAFHRAEFENAYEGKRIVPCDHDYIVSAIPSQYRNAPLYAGHAGTITINVSDALIAAVQRQVPARRRQLKEFS